MTKEDLKRDKYYRKEYGISLAEYKAMLTAQKESCAICGKHQSEFQRSLHVDHDHKLVRAKILVERNTDENGGWVARCSAIDYFENGHLKKIAIYFVRQELKRRSVRGLLCWPCNRGLAKWRDNPVLMESAAQYLRRHQNA